MSEPMTDERLAELQARVKNTWKMQAVGPANLGDLEPWQLQAIAVAYVDDVAALLAKVERQRAVIAEQQAEIAAMRPVVEAVATMEREYSESLKSWVLVPPLTNRNLFTVRLLEQARAYIAQHPATTTGEGEGETP